MKKKKKTHGKKLLEISLWPPEFLGEIVEL